MTASDEILPPPDDPALVPLHDRDYVVRAYRKDESTILIRGAIRDEKPAGLYLVEDERPLTIHHMVIEIEVSMTDMRITRAEAEMLTHPHVMCTDIEPHYEHLVGLSIARGFTHKIRELFGGPRGCTHVTALLQAMAPVAMQSMWSMQVVNNRTLGGPSQRVIPPDERERNISLNVGTCHVWAEGGEYLAQAREGHSSLPIPFRRRLAELGHDPDSWVRQ
jgi:Protein of unknown function (DUF2889)